MGVMLLEGQSRGSCFEQGCGIGFDSCLRPSKAKYPAACLQHHGLVQR